MSGGWVAGSVRATGMASASPEEVSALVAASPDRAGAVSVLRHLGWLQPSEPTDSIEAAQRGVLSTLLWKLRVLAGWLPGEGVELIRSCVAWFEITNVEDRLAYFAGASPGAPFHLGSLGDVSERLPQTTGPADVRQLLESSGWSDPGGGDIASIRWALRRRWHRWLRTSVPEAAGWADAAAAIFIAREAATHQVVAGSLERWPVRLPSAWAWFDGGRARPAELWLAEKRWWNQVADEARSLQRRPVGSRERVVGCVGALAVTAHRLATALEVVGGPPDLVGDGR